MNQKTTPRTWMRSFAFVTVTAIALQSHAQDELFRCGNEYTNNPTKEERLTCRRITSKPLTSLERDQFLKCMNDATKSPTELGVRMAASLCKTKFEQVN